MVTNSNSKEDIVHLKQFMEKRQNENIALFTEALTEWNKTYHLRFYRHAPSLLAAEIASEGQDGNNIVQYLVNNQDKINKLPGFLQAIANEILRDNIVMQDPSNVTLNTSP